MREKEELQQALQEQEEQASVTLQEETRKLSEEQQELKSRLSEAEEARIQAQDQVCARDQDCSQSLAVSKQICFRTNSFLRCFVAMETFATKTRPAV